MDDGPTTLVLDSAGSALLDTTANWFKDAAKSNGDRELLKPVDKAAQQHESFKESFKVAFVRATGVRSLGKTKEAVEQQITVEADPDRPTLKHEASAALDGAVWALRDYQIKRSRGRRKWGATAQSIAAKCGDFLNAYSGVVEVVRKAGSVYGEAAYECISILFIVMLHKRGNDNKLTEALDEMRKSFPKLETWGELYPTLAIKKAVIEVYRNVIDFSHEAARYFLRPWTRWAKAIFSPPSVGFAQTVATVKSSLEEVNSEARFHLHIRSHDIHRVVEDSKKMIERLEKDNVGLHEEVGALVRSYGRLEAQNDALQIQNKQLKDDMDRQELLAAMQKLETIKDICRIEPTYDEADVALCSQNLAKAFSDQPTPARHPPGRRDYLRMTYDLLESCDIFTQWRDSATSALLAFSGKTSRESRKKAKYTHSWLSPAAVLVSEKLREQDKLVAFYSCHVGLYAETAPLRVVLLSVIIQILEHEPRVLHQTFEQVKSLAAESREARDGSSALEPLQRILREILVSLRLPVTIVLDRIEQCDCDLAELMDSLVQLVTQDGMTVKVMVIIDPAGSRFNESTYWDMKSCLTRADRKELAMERVNARLDWDQVKAATTRPDIQHGKDQERFSDEQSA